ncbi:MAG: hypothetical protein GY759_05070 [Chloroflexi bacterium]|nr:hypothetical protein [Chloroflexota bacterium]
MINTTFKYQIADDGVAILLPHVDQNPARIRRTDHLSQTSLVTPDQVFNRGVKRDPCILVTGDLPRFALACSFPGDFPGPDLVKLGEGRIKIHCGDVNLWLDECDHIATLFRPGGTEYYVTSQYLPDLQLRLTVSLAGNWGLVSKLSITNVGEEAVVISVGFEYGGIGRHGRTFRPAYFPSDYDDSVGNQLEVVDQAILIQAPDIPFYVAVSGHSLPQPSIRNSKAWFETTISIAPDEMQSAGIVVGSSQSAELSLSLCANDVDACVEETSQYYDKLLTQTTISTPQPIMDAGFRTAIWNLDSVYSKPAWLEGVHWWSAYWTNLFQISAAIALGQIESARTALEFIGNESFGLILSSGKASGWPPPHELFYFPYDGIFYYIYQLCQYYDYSGDTELVESIWVSLIETLEQVLKEKDENGNGLLSWRLGCNAFLYQADQLGMPGDAASPSLMAAGMIDRLAHLARELGKIDEAQRLQAKADYIHENLPQLWHEAEGVFYNHRDLQGLFHLAHYYTDLIYPVLYAKVPTLYRWQSLAHLRRTLCYRSELPGFDSDLVLMRVGDLLPTMFGNDSVLPAQMAETARACFAMGDNDLGYQLLEAVALAATIHTEAPGNFQERMDDFGKGEFNYLFGNPIGSFAYAVVRGLFGIAITNGGNTFDWQPGFPSSWNHAEMSLPYGHVSFQRSTDDQSVTCVYQVDTGDRGLDFGVFIEPCLLQDVTCNGQTVDLNITSGLGKIRLEFSAQPADSHEIIVKYLPTPVVQSGPQAGIRGDSVRWMFQAPVTHVEDPQGLMADCKVLDDRIEGLIVGQPGHYQIYAHLCPDTYDKLENQPDLVSPIQIQVSEKGDGTSDAVTENDSMRSESGLSQSARSQPLDLSAFYNSSQFWVTSKWRREMKTIDLSSLRDDNGALATPAGRFLAAVEGATMAVVEYGRSHPHTRRTEFFGMPSTLKIPVGCSVSMLSLLYANEVESRLTGSKVGTLKLIYAESEDVEIELQVGKQLDTLYGHWAKETIPVEIGVKKDFLNAWHIPCDSKAVLQAFEINLYAADVQIGLIGANITIEG